MITSCLLGALSVWLHWRPGGWSTAAGGFPLAILSTLGGVAAWMLLNRHRPSLLLAALFFGMQVTTIERAGFWWSFQAGFTMEFPIVTGQTTIIINIVALILMVWCVMLYRRAGTIHPDK